MTVPAGATSATFTVTTNSLSDSQFGPVVRLDARPATGSSFARLRGLPGCADPSRIRVARGTTINCQPGFVLK